MFRKLIGAATLATLLPLPAAAVDGWEIFKQVRPSLVQVVGVGANGRYHMGSGISLPNGTVVTSCHVTMASKQVMLFGGGQGDGAKLQAADVAHDLCTLYFPAVLAAARCRQRLTQPEDRRSGLCHRIQCRPQPHFSGG